MRYEIKRIKIGPTYFNAYIADTFLKKMIGLMYRNKMSQKSCMLFIFSYDDYHSIWMKNMCMNIDVLWVDSGMHIIDYVENIEPCTSIFKCTTFKPAKKCRYIIELNNNAIRKNRIKKGKKIVI